jgi:Flp pilus assembly protein TadD
VSLAGNESTAELKGRADSSTGAEQAKLCMEYAHRQLTEANTQFNQGDVEKGLADIREVVEYAHKAANAASASGKHLKETEIDLRKLAKRMHDISLSLSFEDRDPVSKAVEEIEQIRSDLMVRMWGPQAEPKGKS